MKTLRLLLWNLSSFITKQTTCRFLKILSVTIALVLLSGCAGHGILNPKGTITAQERVLFFDTLALMLIVVIPVIIMSFAFAFKYRKRADNHDYKPNWAHNNLIEAVCWGVPLVIIVILGVWTWDTSHSLDPYKEIDVPGKPMVIQAVSLRWKWLFLYPKQGIATVNYVEMPKNKQVVFWITSDAPMSAFFIPQLGSQIYSMGGMRTRLHLLPTANGTFEGLNTQYNGDGFSDMHFKAKVTDQTDFNQWVKTMQSGHKTLTIAEYKQLVKPSEKVAPIYYAHFKKGLFKRIIEQYRKPNMRLH